MAGEYIPIEDIIAETSPSNESDKVDRFHLQLSTNTLSFSNGQSKMINLTNIGWDRLTFNDVISVGSSFVVEHELPDVLLPGETYSINIEIDEEDVGNYFGGIYIDVGNSYGNKYIQLTGTITGGGEG